jgi:hypothetical protein
MHRSEDPPVPIDPKGPFFHWSGQSELTIAFGEDGALQLPEVILWAFRLREGDLLTLSCEPADPSRCRFEGYIQAGRRISEGIGPAWPYIEELLRLPMAAIGPHGTLILPEGALLLGHSPGDLLRLEVEPSPLQSSFSLEPAEKEVPAHLTLEIRYVLPVENGCIRVPADLRSIAGLDERLLAYETRLGMAEFDLPSSGEPLGHQGLTCLGLDGSLLLPNAFLRNLRPEWPVVLSARVGPKLSFRLTYDTGNI